MTADFVMVPCIVCGRERPILTGTNIHIWDAWRRPCKTCHVQANRRNLTSAHQDEVDEVAVERIMAGWPPADTTPAERRRAVQLLTQRGMPLPEIARRLRVTERTVSRYRQGQAA